MIPAWVADYIGIEFVPHGRSMEGTDCWGLVGMVLKEHYGLTLPDYQYKTPERVEDVPSVDKTFYDYKTDGSWTRVSPGEEQAGDVVLITVGGYTRHCGIVVAPGKMLHAREKTGTVLDDYRRPQFRNTVEGFYRYRAGV